MLPLIQISLILSNLLIHLVQLIHRYPVEIYSTHCQLEGYIFQTMIGMFATNHFRSNCRNLLPTINLLNMLIQKRL
ncbi:hypothetical protein BD408DRAFT_419480 [Parasitella parasitica]|nr:hypothetical protein BD408DRAFT_419480 [Parasitella parasitica]